MCARSCGIIKYTFFPLLTGILLQFVMDFYKALVNITSGIMLPLMTVNLLVHAIVGLMLKILDMEHLMCEVGQAVVQRILGNHESVDNIVCEMHEKLLLQNESMKKVTIKSIYKNLEEARHNVEVFSCASNLAEAWPHLQKVCSLLSSLLILSMQTNLTPLFYFIYIYIFFLLFLRTL